MRPRILFTTTLAAAALLGAAASATPASAASGKATQACFWTRDVNSFQAVNDQTVNIKVGVRDVYQLTLFAPSPDIDWTESLALQSKGSSWICSGLDATLIVPGPIGPQRYPVTSIRKLSTDEVAALPPKQRP